MTVEVKEKIVTVESLAVLHENNKNTYMQKSNPIGSGIMTMDGDANFSGNIDTNSFTIASKIKFVPIQDGVEIVFLDEES